MAWRHFIYGGEISERSWGAESGPPGWAGPPALSPFCCCCSVTMSSSLQPHGLQYARLSCPSPSSRVCSNLCPLSRWCYLTISSSATLLSFFLQSFPASGSFAMSQIFSSGDQSIGASASVLPVNIQGWFPLGLTCWISLQSKGHSRVLQHHSSKASIFQCSAFFMVQLSHPSIPDYWKKHSFHYTDLCWQSDVSAF